MTLGPEYAPDLRTCRYGHATYRRPFQTCPECAAHRQVQRLAYWASREIPEFFKDAACKDEDPNWWTGDGTLRGKAICKTCPIQSQCLAYGLDEPDEMWGGLSPRKRRERNRRVA